MRYLLLICSDDKAAPPAPKAEMDCGPTGLWRSAWPTGRRPASPSSTRSRPRRYAAIASCRRALELADNVREQTFLAGRLAACEARGEGRG